MFKLLTLVVGMVVVMQSHAQSRYELTASLDVTKSQYLINCCELVPTASNLLSVRPNLAAHGKLRFGSNGELIGVSSGHIINRSTTYLPYHTVNRNCYNYYVGNFQVK